MLYPNPQIYAHIKAMFVHVPKAAGTAIENTLKAPGQIVGGHSTALAYRRKFPTEFAASFKFAVVRDPVDRFASAYHYLSQQEPHPALQNQPMRAIAQAAGTLDDFAALLTKEPALAAKIIHLRPMSFFLCDATGKVLVDFVARFENLAADWAAITSKLGILHLPLRHTNRSRRPLLALDATPGVKAFVREAYAQDYETFGY